MRRTAIGKVFVPLAAALALLGCADLPSSSGPPPARTPPPTSTGPVDYQEGLASSPRSVAYAAHYRRLEAAQVARGLMRTDGGGVDTPFNARMLQENFERIAFYDEYARGEGLTLAQETPGQLKRWTIPIRFTVEHGTWASDAVRNADRAEVTRYVERLSRITGHPMTMSNRNPNFHVIYASADDTALLPERVRQIVPNISPAALSIFDDLPRNIHCLVIAFSNGAQSFDYGRAIAIIRAEHPPLMRRSCVHEEIAQGLGLANDYPRARPSIFNDDDEFALLTTHDELLLEMLYDPVFTPGMSLEEARPLIRVASERLVPSPPS